MSFNYDNDVEDLLEKSIDEKYSQNKSRPPNKCPFNYNPKSKPKYSHRINRKVFTVEEKVKFNPLLLPDGWVRLYHDSGMFFYCHAASRVVTWAMPYQLQTEPHRYHRVPVRALPCLSFRLANNLDTDLLTTVTTAGASENDKIQSDGGSITESASGTAGTDPTESHSGDSNKNDREKSMNQKTVVKEDDKSPPLLPLESSSVSEEATADKPKEVCGGTSARNNQSFLQDIEEGEIESTDDEKPEHDNDIARSDGTSRNKTIANEDSVLPKQYRIEGESNLRRSKHPVVRTKQWHSSSGGDSQRKRDRSGSCGAPAKRRKVMSASGVEPVEQPASVHPPDGPTDTPDLSAKLLEPDQMRRYCQKLFTFVEEARYFPRFCFFKKRLLRPNNTANTDPASNTDNSKSMSASGKSLDVTNSNSSSGPVLNDNTVSIHCNERLKIPNKNIYIDLAGRNFNCVLNMYCQNAFGITPTFKASSSLSGIHDFEVTCDIGGTSYAVGEGKTKKIAKQRAVTKTLEILVPGFFNMIQIGCADKSSSMLSTTDGTSMNTSVSGGNNSSNGGQGGNSSLAIITGGNQDSGDARGQEIYSIFDHMDITDPRVFSYTTKLNSIAPYNMLLECMNRHCVLDSHLASTISKSNRHNVYKMKLGDKEVQANCENKREGRQLASQYMLAKLHPHIQRWGGILRLYGPDSKPVKRFDMHEMQNLLLEDRGGVKSNLINLLRRKMLELNEEWQSSNKTYAKFKVPFENIPIIVFHPDSKDQVKQ